MRTLSLPGDKRGVRRHVLDRETSRYLSRVLRLGKDASFPALDERGNRFLCRVVESTPAGVELALEPLAEAEIPAFRIALVQALPKGSKMDLIIRQAVEAGVSDIFPIQTRNCVSREQSAPDRTAKRERREKIIREALQQSGSPIRTKIHETVDTGNLMSILAGEGYSVGNTLFLLCHEQRLASRGLHDLCAGKPENLVLLIGPEGGFDPAETEFLRSQGFTPLHFDGTILRTETAALYAVAAAKTTMTEWNSWNT